MSPNWLILPVITKNQYPKFIREQARKLKNEGVTEEKIAEHRGVSPKDAIRKVAYCREMVECLILIEESPDNPRQSIVSSLDGTYEDINMPVTKLVSLFDEFLATEPTFVREIGIAEVVGPTEIAR